MTQVRERVRIFTLNDPRSMRINNELAAEIGLNNSIVLLQVEYLISIYGRLRQGRYWLRSTIDELRDGHFSFWSRSTLARVINNLALDGLLIVENFNRTGWDRTQWIALNLDALAALQSIRLLRPGNLALPIPTEKSISQSETSISQNEISKSQSDEIDVSNRDIDIPDRANRLSQSETALRKEISDESKNKPNTRDEIYNALESMFGEAVTSSQKRLRTKHANELRSASATPQTLTREARRYRTRFPNAELTAAALVKWYGQLDRPNLNGEGGSPDDGVLRCSHGHPIVIDNDGPMCSCTECDDDRIESLAREAVST